MSIIQFDHHVTKCALCGKTVLNKYCFYTKLYKGSACKDCWSKEKGNYITTLTKKLSATLERLTLLIDDIPSDEFLAEALQDDDYLNVLKNMGNEEIRELLEDDEYYQKELDNFYNYLAQHNI